MAYSRRLPFFDKEIVTSDSGQKIIFEDITPTCTTSGRGFLWIGDTNGFMHRIDRVFNRSHFIAHEKSVQLVHQLKQHDILITVGEDESESEFFKVWNLVKWTNKSPPHCSRKTLTTPQGFPPTRTLCMSVDENLQYLVLGSLDGSVQVFRGNIMRDRQSKRIAVYKFNDIPVTGLALSTTSVPLDSSGKKQKQLKSKQDPDQQSSQESHMSILFAASQESIISIVLSKRDDMQNRTVLDCFGAKINCTCALTASIKGSPQFAVACSNAVYFYTWDARGPCLATDGDKLDIQFFKNYLLIIKGNSNSYLRPYADENEVAEVTGDSRSDSCTVIIHDIANKFIAGEFTIPGLRSVITGQDGIYLLCSHDESMPSSSVLYRLTKKTIQAKLDMLFAKKNFSLAVEIAKSQNFSDEQLAFIAWRHADHLYKLKDYDGAVCEYVKTIGRMDASLVIQRFLEGGQIIQLIRYLEALLETDLVSNEHLILLLNCYTRLQYTKSIDEFVSKNPPHSSLDVKAALHILRQAGFAQSALKLARVATCYVDIVDILVTDLQSCSDALAAIDRFAFDGALNAVCIHGHTLMKQMPTKTVELLKRICSHPEARHINLQHFLRIFIDNPFALMQFLQRYLTDNAESVKVAGVADTLLELVLCQIENTTKPDYVQLPDAPINSEDLIKMAMQLLQTSEYDDKKALMLCCRRNFTPGYLFLWEKMKMFDRILKHHMDADDSFNVMSTCKLFGDEMPELWLTSLSYFARKPDQSDLLSKVIDEVDRCSLATPLRVLQILSEVDESQSCSLGVVKGYLLRHLEAGANRIASVQTEVERLCAETMQDREMVRTLTEGVKVFQRQKCSLCHQGLEPPSVHFLCDHSYHKSCFENYAHPDQSCPECAPKNRKLLTSLSASFKSTLSPSSTVCASTADQVARQLEQAFTTMRTTSQPPNDGQQSRPLSGFDSPRLSHAIASTLIANNESTGPTTAVKMTSLTPSQRFTTENPRLSTPLPKPDGSPTVSSKSLVVGSGEEASKQPSSSSLADSAGYFSSTASAAQSATTTAGEPVKTGNPFEEQEDSVKQPSSNPFDDASITSSIGSTDSSKATATPFDSKISTNPFD